MDLSKIAWNYSVLKTVPEDILPILMVRTSHYHITNVLEDIYKCIEDTDRENPEYQQVYFDDNDCREFIADHYSEYLSDYDVIIPGAYKADVFRLLFLYYYGGIYNDSSQRYLVPVKDLVDSKMIVLVNDLDCRGFFNAFMASPPQHPLIKKMIDLVIDNVRNRFYGDDVLDITGPHALRKAVLEYYSLPDDFDFHQINEYNEMIIYHYLDYSFIYNEFGTIIQTKFEDYNEKVYLRTGKIKYADAWFERNVYLS
jgi:mannosyltransferase OCH1-like enzyme